MLTNQNTDHATLLLDWLGRMGMSKGLPAPAEATTPHPEGGRNLAERLGLRVIRSLADGTAAVNMGAEQLALLPKDQVLEISGDDATAVLTAVSDSGLWGQRRGPGPSAVADVDAFVDEVVRRTTADEGYVVAKLTPQQGLAMKFFATAVERNNVFFYSTPHPQDPVVDVYSARMGDTTIELSHDEVAQLPATFGKV